VRDQLADRLNIIVDGGTSPRELPSTIVDLTVEDLGRSCWRIQREGAIPADQIAAALRGQ
jgi:tRNA A37 threonylcarbamoyladenosine synthetase subunit TsaC/SUA5/YrdC